MILYDILFRYEWSIEMVKASCVELWSQTERWNTYLLVQVLYTKSYLCIKWCVFFLYVHETFRDAFPIQIADCVWCRLIRMLDFVLVNKTFLKGHVWRGEKMLNDFGECDSTVASEITTTYIAHPNIFFRRLAIVFACPFCYTRASGSCSSQLGGFVMFQDA